MTSSGASHGKLPIARPPTKLVAARDAAPSACCFEQPAVNSSSAVLLATMVDQLSAASYPLICNLWRPALALHLQDNGARVTPLLIS